MLRAGWKGFLLLLPLLFINAAFGADETADADAVRIRLSQILDREGYVGQYRHGQALQRAVSAYLWDHRQQKVIKGLVLVCKCQSAHDLDLELLEWFFRFLT